MNIMNKINNLKVYKKFGYTSADYTFYINKDNFYIAISNESFELIDKDYFDYVTIDTYDVYEYDMNFDISKYPNSILDRVYGIFLTQYRLYKLKEII